MSHSLRSRPRTDRLALLDEEDQARSPSYFEWREQTGRMKAFRAEPKPQPKLNPFIRLFRRSA